MSTVSVVIPTYNRAHVLAAAIDSALDQTHPPLEVIVIDDGSTDSTGDLLAGFGERINVLRQDNRGVAAARNRGIGAARGDFVLFLDSDDVLLPACIERLLARFEAEPRLGLVSGDSEFCDSQGRVVRVRRGGVEGNVAADFLLLEREVLGSGSAIMIPRRILEETGGFDERLRVSEDWDLYYRIAVRGPIGRVPEVVVRCRDSDDGLHHDSEKMEHGMLLAFDKAFAGADTPPELLALRSRAYARLHFVLAGCCFRVGRHARAVRHLLLSGRHHPRLFTRLLLARLTR